MANAQLTWTPSDTGITEIKSYLIFRNVDDGEYAVLIECAVQRDMFGGIIGIENCTTDASPNDDTGQVLTTFIEDAPVTYVDSSLNDGHTYCYYVQATPMGNTIYNGSGPPSPPSNIVCVTTSDVQCDLHLTAGSSNGAPGPSLGFSQGWPAPAALTGTGGPFNQVPTVFANIGGQFQMTVTDTAPLFHDIEFVELGIVLLRIAATVISGEGTVTYQWPDPIAGLVFGTRYCVDIGAES